MHQARLTLGPDGNLYGTSRNGGSTNLGTIFSIATNGDFHAVNFLRGHQWRRSLGELAVGPDGQLYGTTRMAAAPTFGTVFKMTTNGILTTIVSFSDQAFSMPQAGLVLASDGNFYGCSQGAVFQMTPDGFTTVASLIPLNGTHPQAGLLRAGWHNFMEPRSTCEQ